MRLGEGAGGLRVLGVLVLLTVAQVRAQQQPPVKERRYYIAAVEIAWNYGEHGSGPTYKKVVFREYEEGFREAKAHPSWLGLLGPTLRAEEGETIVVTFRNMAEGRHSIHPHGVSYGKQSEGAHYFDNTYQKEKQDDIVLPNSEHIYTWEVTSDVSPQENDPTCLTYTYISHEDVVKDYNSGLIGALLICKPGNLNETREQAGIGHEYVFLFGVFDEKRSKYEPHGYSSNNHVKYTINGYTKGSLPDVSMCAYASVSLHLIGMSSSSEVFSVHINGQVLQQMGHKVSSVGLISGSTATASMVALHTGRWLISSHTIKHMEVGLHGFVDVKLCEEFTQPVRWLTLNQRRESIEWTYYIAAEEVIWDYAPNTHEHIDKDFKQQFLKQSSTRIGGRYKKAVYTLYKNASFTERLESQQRKNELGILGPVIRAQIRDIIKIVFKNKASRPYSIYPHGLTIEKSEEGVNYPEGGNQSHGVQPGETHTYVWKVVEEDEPLDGDSRCLTRVYHSAVDTPRDISSGLIGPILICKSRSLNIRNVQLRADKEQHAFFTVFDENKSWYFEDNLRQYCDQPKVNRADPDFYKSNVMHTINGYAFESGPILGFCNGEVATWHVASIGAQDNIQTATFYGHPFELNERTEDFLSLYPMTGETVTMKMDNIGVWLLASLNTHGTTKGMRVKFQDVECYRDIEYEDDYSTVWNPLSLDDIKQHKEEIPAEKVTVEPDDYTEKWAEKWGIRSAKNSSSVSDMEQVDLSFLDYDAVDVPDGENSSFTSESERVHVSKADDNQTSLERILVEDSEEIHLRGDVFSYSVPSISSGDIVPNYNVSVPVDMPADGTNLSSISSVDVEVISLNNKKTDNLELLLENTDSKASKDDSLITETELGYGLQMNSSEALIIQANSTLENGTHNNVTLDLPRSNLLGRGSFGSKENVTTPLVELTSSSSEENVFNETVVSGNLSLPGAAVEKSSSEELSLSVSSEEVFIYLKENNTEVIKTTLLKPKEHNWKYKGTHEMETEEIPKDLKKYFENEAPPKKKVKKITLRQRPEKGQGMKTRKRKVYKPQARSGLPFSPRGFNPGFNPRGSRPNVPQPISDESELIDMAVVIGVPRPDFSEYELYGTMDESGNLGLDEDIGADEYEYVRYKDPYLSHEDIKDLNLDETTQYYLKIAGPDVKTYFIAAEEVEWDYFGYGQRRQEKSQLHSREHRFTKVVFRGYMDNSFSTPDIRGETDEHLGILGPVIKAEVGQSIMVVFRNKATRPYSIHPNGVSYTKQMEGLSYEDSSKYWFKYDNEVQPDTTYTYLWKVSDMVGPKQGESHCRTWAYYSGVNPERDIHSGLIGPLLVCQKGTLNNSTQPFMRDFTLLFMTFDESQSWYYEKNFEMVQRKTRRRFMDSNFKENLKFHSINGIVYSLKGLRMYTNQLVCWHLINMGSPDDFHSVHFHGQTFIQKKTTSYRQAVYPLLPGGFATLEMYPTKPGLWQLETEVGFNQQKGMQTLFLVLDNDCYRPLGLESGSVKDKQITASSTRGYWEPHLARLNNHGKYNAWSTDEKNGFIQVDFQRPVVISQVATQGAKQMFYSQYVTKYAISYSNDRRKWIFYKGESKGFNKVFDGNQEAYEMKTNTLFPPVIGRFVRLHPIESYNKATVRMEFFGCEVDGCSVPLGMESGLIEDGKITASSTHSNWYFGRWSPSFARLNKQGAVNAWRAQTTDINQWLQVELPQVMKITGIITQGAKSLGKEMYVVSYRLQYSGDGNSWIDYTEDEDQPARIFTGNTNNNDHMKNYIYPPIFSRFVRILPQTWMNSITMRVELLGCDFE
ncbi:coagulation factor V [Pholidichthys leucotaenia]